MVVKMRFVSIFFIFIIFTVVAAGGGMAYAADSPDDVMVSWDEWEEIAEEVQENSSDKDNQTTGYAERFEAGLYENTPMNEPDPEDVSQQEERIQSMVNHYLIPAAGVTAGFIGLFFYYTISWWMPMVVFQILMMVPLFAIVGWVCLKVVELSEEVMP